MVIFRKLLFSLLYEDLGLAQIATGKIKRPSFWYIFVIIYFYNFNRFFSQLSWFVILQSNTSFGPGWQKMSMCTSSFNLSTLFPHSARPKSVFECGLRGKSALPREELVECQPFVFFPKKINSNDKLDQNET